MNTTVLIAALDASIHNFIRTCLEEQHANVIWAKDGRNALRALEEHSADLIVTTADLGDISGFDFCRMARANPHAAGAVVVFVSKAADAADRIRALDAGAGDYLLIGMDPAEVRARLRSALRWAQLQKDLERQNQLLYQLHQFSLRLNAMERLEDTLRMTLICSMSLTNSGRAFIMLPNPTNDRLAVACVEGTGNLDIMGDKVKIGAPISGVVFKRNDAQVVNDTSKITLETASDLALFGMPPLVSVPISSDAGCLGVLNVTDKRLELVYTSKDIRILRCVGATAGVAIESQRRRSHMDHVRDAALVGLASLAESRDLETGDHLERLRVYAVRIAEELRKTDKYGRIIDQRYLDALSRAVPMHDIGKVGIPDQILLKPGKLTDAEFEIMKTHSVVGASVLRSMIERTGHDSFLDMACDIARHHHERYDGSGYPEGLAGEAIPLAARITAVADVYDALANDRVYRKAWPHERVLEYIREGSGGQFDPDIAQVVVDLGNEFRRIKPSAQSAEGRITKPEQLMIGASV